MKISDNDHYNLSQQLQRNNNNSNTNNITEVENLVSYLVMTSFLNVARCVLWRLREDIEP